MRQAEDTKWDDVVLSSASSSPKQDDALNFLFPPSYPSSSPQKETQLESLSRSISSNFNIFAGILPPDLKDFQMLLPTFALKFPRQLKSKEKVQKIFA